MTYPSDCSCGWERLEIRLILHSISDASDACMVGVGANLVCISSHLRGSCEKLSAIGPDHRLCIGRRNSSGWNAIEFSDTKLYLCLL